MGQGGEQSEINSELGSSIGVLLGERGVTNTYVGTDQFFGWMKSEPRVRVSPDVYLLDDPPPPPLPAMWKTWKGHKPPRLALEIVSGDDKKRARWKKDYEDNPEKYSRLGSNELVVFDPDVAVGLAPEPERVILQVYRRQADNSFVRVYSGSGPAESRELGAYFVLTFVGAAARLRVSRDAAGTDIVPTTKEKSIADTAARLRAEAQTKEADAKAKKADAKAKKADAKAKRADAKAKRADAKAKEADAKAKEADAKAKEAEAARELERSAREQAESELARLRAELDRPKSRR